MPQRWDHAADALESATLETVALLDEDIRRMIRTRNMLAAALTADGESVPPLNIARLTQVLPPSGEDRIPDVISYSGSSGSVPDDYLHSGENAKMARPSSVLRSHALIVDSIPGRVAVLILDCGALRRPVIACRTGFKQSSLGFMTDSGWFVRKGTGANAVWELTPGGRDAAAQLKAMATPTTEAV